MPATTRHDPYKNFPFRVEIDGVATSGFREVSGLSAEAQVIEYARARTRPRCASCRDSSSIRT